MKDLEMRPAKPMFARHSRRRSMFGAMRRQRNVVEILEARRLLTLIPVTTLDDAGPGSLRDAIAQANSMPGDDRIEFASGLTGAVNLSSALPVLSSNIDVQGPGAGLLTVRRDSASSFRIFFIENPATVTLAGLTISNGLASGESRDGGGVLNRGTLTLIDCVVSNNNATLRGGGIYNSGAALARLTLTNTIVSGNTAPSGAGIANFTSATVQMSNSAVSDNDATGSFGGGGGINNSGVMNLDGCMISGNSVTYVGGGIGNSGMMTLTACTISTNSSGSDGGGFWNHGGILKLTNCTVSGNFCTDNQGSFGGGIYNFGGVVLTNSTISGNSAADRGGGIFNSNQSGMIVTNCTIANNHTESGGWADGRGGGIHNSPLGTATLNNTIVAGNTQGEFRVPDDLYNFNGFVTGNFSLIDAISFGTVTGESNQIDVDARLAPLADNGGPTLTHALHLESPAVDAGSTALALDPDGQPLLTDQRGSGFLRVTGSAVEIGAIEAQTRAPDVLQADFRFETLPIGVRFGFNSDVAPSLDLADIVVRNLTTQTTISPTSLHYDAATDVATFSFTGIVPEGNYRATIIASGVIGPTGLPMQQDEEFEFFFLMADANHDRRIDLHDFNRLAQNFGQSERNFTQGDFNYDSLVNIEDFNILASRFGGFLPETAGRAGGLRADNGAWSVEDQDPWGDLLA
jgi:hypothetical protein